MMTGSGWAVGLGGWPSMLLALIVGIAIVLAVARLVTAAMPARQRSNTGDPGQILMARLSCGELSEQEYEHARRLISCDTQPT